MALGLGRWVEFSIRRFFASGQKENFNGVQFSFESVSVKSVMANQIEDKMRLRFGKQKTYSICRSSIRQCLDVRNKC